MSKIRLGILGGGGDSLIGIVHRIASGMFDEFDLVGGCFNPNTQVNIDFGKKIGINEKRIYTNFESLIEAELSLPKSERIQVVSVLTPNFLHYPMAKKLIQNDFNVICEKPLTTTYSEAQKLELEVKKKDLVFAVTYTYTGYPIVREMMQMIKDGAIGEIQKVDLQYYQGWINPIIKDPELRKKVWRLDPDKGGLSCCIGDIGTHAFNMAEFLTGMKIDKILADLNYLYPENQMDVDGTILVRFSDYCKGVIRASQIATAEENSFTVQIYGKNGCFKWNQENPNYLYHLMEGKPIQILKPGNSYLSDFSLKSSKLPPGHPEGFFDAMGNIYNGVAKTLKKVQKDDGSYPSINEGVRGMMFIEKVLESNKNGNKWIKLD